MENMQKQIDALRGDVDQVTDKLDRVLEILASLSLPSRVDVATVGANPLIGSPLSKVVWPSFGSSSGYTSAAAQVTQEPMGTNTEFMVGQRRTHQVQPKFAHQDDNFKGKSVVSPSEETRQRLKAIEDKLRMMESFLPNNVCPPHSHSRSTVPARTPCFKHQYPAVVHHQQPQGHTFQMPVNPVPQRAQQRVKKVFDPIPVSYGELLPYLVNNGMVVPIALLPRNPHFPAWYDPKAKCAYHADAEGHSTDNCRAFKNKVQELIEQKLLTFQEGEPNCEG
ncbi:hypothetical protein QL285_087213 [Trifolium repens]|nr:hypothetical protein QL285_087213 [Trifolium repens]